MEAITVIGGNYGDEGKGTVVARLTSKATNAGKTVINVLTNGGAQRGHSVLTTSGDTTYQHFGSGTEFGADTYYSSYFILNPMQFVKEYESLVVKPKEILRHPDCLWTTPYDSFANLISETLQKRTASCCMGIWNTIRRSKVIHYNFNVFLLNLPFEGQMDYLQRVKKFYEKEMIIPDKYKPIWDSQVLKIHFLNDCNFMLTHTHQFKGDYCDYDTVIFENGQGLLLSDTGKDTFDTTPSDTGSTYSKEILKHWVERCGEPLNSFKIHYVTRPYLTRHGDGNITDQVSREGLSSNIEEDRTNHHNEFQGEFRYGKLDVKSLVKRFDKDSGGIGYVVDVTHCDEMDRHEEFDKYFPNRVNYIDTPLVT